MFMKVVTFLSENKLVLVGAVTCVCEILVILVNTYRAIRSNKAMSVRKEKSLTEILLWSANPLNLFKNP